MRRLAFFLAQGLAAALVGGSPARSATVWQVPAGGGDLHDIDLLHFTVKEHRLRVQVGDSVTWTNRSLGAPHTVSFLGGGPRPPLLVPAQGGVVIGNPEALFPSQRAPVYDGEGFIGSGMLEPGQSWSLAFTRPGTYEYVCLFHPPMRSWVVVEEAGAAMTVSQTDLDADYPTHSALHQKQAEDAARGMLVGAPSPGPGGSAIWRVAAGGTTAATTKNAFMPSTLKVREGDQVTWAWPNTNREPHTVTFLAGEPHPGDIFIPQPQPQGPPVLVVNFKFGAPSRLPDGIWSTGYDGVGFLNSGLAGGDASLFSPDLAEIAGAGTRTNWSVTFTKAGTYPYQCLLHPGMQGIIEVMPRDAWPPADIELGASHSEDWVTFRFDIHNRSSSELTNLLVSAAVPDNATFVDSWFGTEFRAKGQFTGREVIWADDGSVKDAGSRGPYSFTLKAKAGVDPHDVMSHVWVRFGGAVPGTALSGDVAAIAPEMEGEHGH